MGARGPSPETTLADVLDAMDRAGEPGEPLTTTEVADELDCSRRTTYDKLVRLADRGDVKTKKTGARGRVWWRPVCERLTGPALNALHAAIRRIVRADDSDDVGEAAVAAVADAVGLAAAAVYCFDPTENALEPASASGRGDDRPSTPGPDSPVRSSYVDGATRVLDADAEPVLPGSGQRTEIVVPVGEHGVLVAAADGSLDADGRYLVDAVAAVAEAALDRLAARDRLRDRRARVEEQERRLRRLTRINTVIREVDKGLVRASTREEIERIVCDRFTDDDRFRFAWIGAPDDAGDRLVPEAWSGEGRDYLDAASLALDGDEPAARAYREADVTVVPNVADGVRSAGWRKAAFSREFHSVVSVPLTYGEVTYGVLSVFADRPGVFEQMEQSVFAELGATVADAVDAVETREALLHEPVVELEFAVEGAPTPLTRLAAEAGAEMAVEGTVPLTERRSRVFLTVDATAADRVVEAAADSVGVEECDVVTGTGDGRLVEAVVAGRSIPATVAEWNAALREFVVDGSTATLVVALPSSADVRRFAEAVTERHEGAAFVARREREWPLATCDGFRARVEERLTDRQLEVLRTAYLAGYFDSPRGITGDELAAVLDVSQPTVTEHVRTAEAKLLDLLFDESPKPP